MTLTSWSMSWACGISTTPPSITLSMYCVTVESLIVLRTVLTIGTCRCTVSSTLSTARLLACVRSSPESCCLVATISDASLAHVGHCVLRVLEHDNLVVCAHLEVILAVVHATRDVEILLADASHHLVALVVLTFAVNHAPLHWSSRTSGCPRCSGLLLSSLLGLLFSPLSGFALLLPAVGFALVSAVGFVLLS